MEVSELFDICQQLAVHGPSAEGRQQMHEVMLLACAEGTRGAGGSFGNLFSQIDFVCKRYGIASSERVAIQTVRRHAHHPELPDRESWLYDLRALSLLVSAVFNQSVPGSLLSLLPLHGRPLPTSLAEKRPYVRCIVRSWDEQHVTVSTDEGDMTFDYATTDDGRDFTYLRKLLRVGMQLNLLDCNPRPSLVVVEPDFLVDVSSIASCFTNYGHHPLLYTVSRLKQRPNTQATLLGNFAGAALDEVIYSGKWREERGEWKVERGEKCDLSKTLHRSFREQALRFCACEDFDAARFKRDAAQQLRNIKEAVSVLFSNNTPRSNLSPHNSSHFLPLLEPSFVCERLGLQGRVDLMTSDMSLLVEQKSGKNMKIEHSSHDAHGLQLESHYVQLLLYYGILRYNFGRTDQTVDTRLLYSHYPATQGVLAVNYYRTLFREAIRFRNQLVATELMVAREGFGRLIPLFTPEIIYKDVKPDGYFVKYVQPELLHLNAQLSCLQPIERAYYERMMTFVYREQVYQKLGGADVQLQHGGGCASDLWQMSLNEKLASGNIFLDLTVIGLEKSDEWGGYDLITLQQSAVMNDVLPNFRRGDMVWLYAYRDQPDVRKSILYKGTLDEVGVDRLVVRLSNGQQNVQVFSADDKKRWAIEHGSSDLSASTGMRAIHQFITSDVRRRQLLLGQRAPRADMSRQLSQSYSSTYDPLLLKACQATDYFLLIGPPGTGKTSQALRFMVAEELTRSDTTVLLTAYTNRAVDEICAMLEGEGWPYLRVGNAASCDSRFRNHLLEAMLGHITRLDDMRTMLQQMPVVVGTTSTLQSHQEILQLKPFSLCIVDEASQILEPNIIGLLSHSSIGRFVLVGDYKQLPAVVQQRAIDARVDEPCLQEIGLTDCRQSLFERLIRWEQRQHRSQFMGVLNHQGRMHPTVAAFPCVHFYAQEQLQPVPLDHQLEPSLDYREPSLDKLDDELKTRRVVFFDSDNEALLVAKLLVRIHRFYGERFDADKTVGVIVTYRSQIARIRKELAVTRVPELLNVSIDTVERYQGSQRDVIVYSFGIDHLYQLDFLTANTFWENNQPVDRKLNVAMTRARCQLILAGRAQLLERVSLFREIISHYGSTLSSF